MADSDGRYTVEDAKNEARAAGAVEPEAGEVPAPATPAPPVPAPVPAKPAAGKAQAPAATT